MSAIDEKSNHLSTKITTDKSQNTLKLRDEMITEELKMLHNEFFVVPNDKASYCLCLSNARCSSLDQ